VEKGAFLPQFVARCPRFYLSLLKHHLFSIDLYARSSRRLAFFGLRVRDLPDPLLVDACTVGKCFVEVPLLGFQLVLRYDMVRVFGV
jgi:hypothetical protein